MKHPVPSREHSASSSCHSKALWSTIVACIHVTVHLYRAHRTFVVTTTVPVFMSQCTCTEITASYRVHSVPPTHCCELNSCHHVSVECDVYTRHHNVPWFCHGTPVLSTAYPVCTSQYPVPYLESTGPCLMSQYIGTELTASSLYSQCPLLMSQHSCSELTVKPHTDSSVLVYISECPVQGS